MRACFALRNLHAYSASFASLWHGLQAGTRLSRPLTYDPITAKAFGLTARPTLLARAE
jgi:hypothetical protein